MARSAPAAFAGRGLVEDRATAGNSSNSALVLLGRRRPGLDEVGPVARSCGAGPGRGASGRSGRGRPSAARRAPPSPGSRRAGCTAGPRAGPSANDSSVGRLVVAHHAGHEPSDGLDHDQRGHLAAGQHEVADRQLVVDEVLAHPLVDALVAPAQQREAVRRRQRTRLALVEALGRRGRAGTAAAPDRRPRPRRTAARACSTMPAPPPNGVSSTDAMRIGRVPSAGRAHAGRAGLARALARAGSARGSRRRASGRS